MKRPKNTTHISVMLSLAEKEALDAHVRESGKTRNRFIRDLFASLRKKP